MDFQGKGAPLSATGLNKVQQVLGTGASEIWSVLAVETFGCGFLKDRRPSILFEQHIFHRETGGRFDSIAPDISSSQPGNYGPAGAHQYTRLQRAVAMDRRAAFCGTSWGIGQVMGFNAREAGFDDVEKMVAAMSESEDEQLLAMGNWIRSSGLDDDLRTHDWQGFARGYNGPNYAINQYDRRLAAAYQKYSAGLLPDLKVRAAQLYLTYLDYSPGPIDGVAGRLTRSAVQQFQLQQEISANGIIDDDIVARLETAVG